MATARRGVSCGTTWLFLSVDGLQQYAIFKAGLHDINIWYGAARTTTLLMDQPVPATASNKTEYKNRGWCMFERRLSAIVKDNDCLLSLAHFTGRNSYWPGVRMECAAHRPPPMTPIEFESMIHSGLSAGSVKFTNGKDATEIVIPQYARGFYRLMHDAVEFDYADLEWGDEDVIKLAEALTYAHKLGALQNVRKLNLMKNSIGDAGMDALANVILAGGLPKLRKKGLQAHFNPASRQAQAKVQEALKRQGTPS